MKKKNSILASFASNELSTKQLKNVYGGTEITTPPPTSTPSSGGSVDYGGNPPPGYTPPPTGSGSGTAWNGDSDTKPRTGSQQIP
ncbi:bacteriocin [Flavobacterium sp. NRK F7]|uniref:bacteriocin n=1 Tax=Flavobacterium sp. NRK F7 TaxID=2954930 RepID=UPI0020909BC5|nr:bacteriocin [Flavobacterium sp. NRK F7]MCO6162065.1 bacteriocin [Flavobacterium sp. NRK F7]